MPVTQVLVNAVIKGPLLHGYPMEHYFPVYKTVLEALLDLLSQLPLWHQEYPSNLENRETKDSQGTQPSGVSLQMVVETRRE